MVYVYGRYFLTDHKSLFCIIYLWLFFFGLPHGFLCSSQLLYLRA